METLTKIFNQFEQAPLVVWLWVIPLTLVIWFIPSILAIFFNRKHLKLIALANIPAGFSFVAWGACIVWAVTGRITERMRAHNKPADKINNE